MYLFTICFTKLCGDLNDFGLKHGVEDKIRWHFPHKIVFKTLVLDVCNDKEATCGFRAFGSSGCFMCFVV